MRLEVRCCCQPRKLLGWLDVPERLAKAGTVIRFVVDEGLRDQNGAPHYSQLALPVEWYRLSWAANAQLALKSEETPIEVLRRIGGFTENPECR